MRDTFDKSAEHRAMEYGMMAIAALGVFSGFLLKLPYFLIVVGLLFVLSVGFSAFSEMSFLRATTVVIGAQIILQLCYVIGVKLAIIVEKSGRRPHVL